MYKINLRREVERRGQTSGGPQGRGQRGSEWVPACSQTWPWWSWQSEHGGHRQRTHKRPVLCSRRTGKGRPARQRIFRQVPWKLAPPAPMCASKSQWEPTLPSSQGCEETLSTQEAPQGGDRTFVPKALCSVSGQHTGNPELHPTQQYRATAPPLSWGGLRRDSGVLEISASPGGNKAPHHGVKRGHGRGRSSDPTQQKQGPLQPWVSEEPHRERLDFLI